MRQFLILSLLILCFTLVDATDYVGTMVVGNGIYTQKGVRVSVAGDTLTIYDAKFSFFMPMRLDVSIPNIKQEGVIFEGDNITPLVKGEPYTKRRVNKLRGVATNNTLNMHLYFGDKKLTFNGTKR